MSGRQDKTPRTHLTDTYSRLSQALIALDHAPLLQLRHPSRLASPGRVLIRLLNQIGLGVVGSAEWFRPRQDSFYPNVSQSKGKVGRLEFGGESETLYNTNQFNGLGLSTTPKNIYL
jgi:hypothetical protein